MFYIITIISILAAYEKGNSRLSSSAIAASNVIDKSPLSKINKNTTIAFNHLYISSQMFKNERLVLIKFKLFLILNNSNSIGGNISKTIYESMNGAMQVASKIVQPIGGQQQHSREQQRRKQMEQTICSKNIDNSIDENSSKSTIDQRDYTSPLTSSSSSSANNSPFRQTISPILSPKIDLFLRKSGSLVCFDLLSVTLTTLILDKR